MVDRIKFVTNAHVDAILRAMRAGGFLTADASVEALRDIDQGMTDTEIDAVVNSLAYGTAGLAKIGSATDLFALVDNDALPTPPENNKNYFRLMRWQDTTDVSNPEHHMMTVHWPQADKLRIQAIVGPDTPSIRANAPVGVNTAYNSALYLGGFREGSINDDRVAALGYIGAGVNETTTPGLGANAGVRIHGSYGPVELSTRSVFPSFLFTVADVNYMNGNDPSSDWGGGSIINMGQFSMSGTGPVFFVGDGINGSGGAGAIYTGQTTKGWTIKDVSTSDYPWLNLRGSNADYKYQVVINGDEASSTRTPSNFKNAALTVLSADSPTNGCCAFVHMATSHANNPVLDLRSYDEDPNSDNYHFIECTQRSGGSWSQIRFFVDNIGNVKADGNYTSPAADVAEWVTTDEQYEYGTVLVVSGDSEFTKATVAEDSKIAGVVALKPGMSFGRGMEKEDPENKRPMTVCGITPVKCTTAAGAISPGDLLVSSTEGMAQKAGADPAPGTILGKSLGTLEQPGEDVVTGEVSCFINLQ